jgi:hypothetical protein
VFPSSDRMPTLAKQPVSMLRNHKKSFFSRCYPPAKWDLELAKTGCPLPVVRQSSMAILTC